MRANMLSNKASNIGANVRFGLLRFQTTNLGDDIQALAASRFIPRIDVMIDRDHMDEYCSELTTMVIMNSWWAHRAATWPPPSCVLPLLISVHITTSHDLVHKVTSGVGLDFARRHGPVGCRDLHTLDLFRRVGVDAYLSRCLTLTFPEYRGQRDGRILFVDVLSGQCECEHESRKWWDSIPPDARNRISFLTHRCLPAIGVGHRMKVAETLVSEYRTASLVVTSRLHCALPCIAMGTPVLFVTPETSSERLGGLIELLRVVEPADVLRGHWPVDWEHPPMNPIDVTVIRRDLWARCTRFVDLATCRIKRTMCSGRRYRHY